MIRKTIYSLEKKQSKLHLFGKLLSRISIYSLHSYPACPPAAHGGYKKLPESVVLPHPWPSRQKLSCTCWHCFLGGYPIISHMKGWFSRLNLTNQHVQLWKWSIGIYKRWIQLDPTGFTADGWKSWLVHSIKKIRWLAMIVCASSECCHLWTQNNHIFFLQAFLTSP